MTAAPVIARSLDARPLGRLFWKEYRQQRSLWLVTLAMGMVVQLAFRVLLGSSLFERELMQLVWGVPLFMCVFYLIGSSAMLFALEREERTSDWLVSLATPPGWTLLAKYGFALVSMLALGAVMVLWALVLTAGHPIPLFEPVFELGPEHQSTGMKLVGIGLFLGLVFLGVLAWGTLGSLTSRRVIEAVPVALVWWIMIVCVPMAVFAFLLNNQLNSTTKDRLIEVGLGIAFLGVVAADVWLGRRWCQGRYVDARFLDDFNEWASARLKRRKARASRIPARVEYEFSGWRTWQRLVWQERQRESLHTGLLVIVCAIGVLLALFSLADQGEITFAVIPFVVALPCAMGVLGFRFDAGAQQLRFLANRGASPTMIWLAKHAVWLPRAFWIPTVCWTVAWLAEWVFIPWYDRPLSAQYGGDGARHFLAVLSFFHRRYFFDVMWFALMSYAVGQAAAMLFRRTILAIGAGLIATILLANWQIFAVSVPLPRWWAVGGIAVWLMCLTGWYSRHWLIERRSGPVLKRLVVGLTLPPLLILIGAALYRWLEFPGFGPSSPTLMALLYPREAAHRNSIIVRDAASRNHPLDEIRAAINAVSQPTSSESSRVQDRLASVNRNYRPFSQIQVDPEFVASLPADASPEEQYRMARKRFWSFNEKALAEIMDVLSAELPASYRTQRKSRPLETAMPNPQLLLDAGRLSLFEPGGSQEMLRYYLAGLRLARCSASEGELWYWVTGREMQAEILQSLVEWSNHDDVTREMLIAAIDQTREELSRFPTLREASVAAFVWSEEFLRLQLENEEDPASLRFAKHAAATLLPHEFARRTRSSEQVLFWRWHLYHMLEWSMRTPGANPQRQIDILKEQFARGSASDNEWWYAVFQPGISSRFGQDIASAVISYEAVNRQAMLALAISLWKKDHDGTLPDSLADLARYGMIDGRKEPERVLPVMALNDPWTGAMFGYSAESRKLADSDDDASVVILSSNGPNAFGQQNRAVKNVSEKGLAFVSPSTIVGEPQGIMIHSGEFGLSLWFPSKLQH